MSTAVMPTAVLSPPASPMRSDEDRSGSSDDDAKDAPVASKVREHRGAAIRMPWLGPREHRTWAKPVQLVGIGLASARALRIAFSYAGLCGGLHGRLHAAEVRPFRGARPRSAACSAWRPTSPARPRCRLDKQFPCLRAYWILPS
jgi:hypothetical protein